MPRYLIHYRYSLFNCLSLKKRLKVESCNFFCGGWKSTKFDFSTFKDGAYYCYCAYVLRISRYSDFLLAVLIYSGIFLRGSKLCGKSRT